MCLRIVVPQVYVGKRLLSSGCVTVQSDRYSRKEEPAASSLRDRIGPSTQKWGSTGPLRGWYLLLPLALQLAAGFGLSNNTSPFFPICHQLSPSSHFQHLKISFYFFSPSFPGSSSSSRPFQFLSEDLFGHPNLLHSLQVTQPTYPLPLYPFYYIFSFTHLF